MDHVLYEPFMDHFKTGDINALAFHFLFNNVNRTAIPHNPIVIYFCVFGIPVSVHICVRLCVRACALGVHAG